MLPGMSITSTAVVALTLLATATTTAAAGGNFDYVARAGDDTTAEHVTVVRSRNAITGFTTTVAYEKGAVLETRDDGYTVELTTGFGFVPAWAFIGLPRFAALSIDAAQIEATVFVLDCDLEGFCTELSNDPAVGRLEVIWAASGAATRGPGASYAISAHAHGTAFDGALDLVGDLSASIY